MIPLGPVVARSRARAPRAAVWAYFVDPERRKEWWPELQLDPRVGGAVAEQWTETDEGAAITRDASGDIDVWVDGHAIGFRWSDAGDPHATAVLVTLRSRGAETGITVTETGFDVLPAAAERAAASQEGWQVLLADLVESVEEAVAAGAFAEEMAVAAEGLEAEGLAAEGLAAEPVAEFAEFAEAESGDLAADTVFVAEIPAEETPAEEAPAEDPGPEEAPAADPEPEEAPAADPEPEPEEALVDDPEPEVHAFAELGFEDPDAEAAEPAGDAGSDDGDFPDEPNFDDLIRGPQKD